MYPGEPSRPARAPAAEAVGRDARVWTDRLTLPTHEVHNDPVPRFQAIDGRKFYPYPAQTDIDLEARPRCWTVVCMENRYLKVQVMPELGGRVFSLYDKLAGQEMVYRQASIKPVTAGIRGAWTAGGIEFNFPDCHSVSTHDEVHWTTRHYPDGSVSVLIGDIERISRMGWTVELRLHPERACLEDRVSLINRTPIRQRCFYWTNAAVEGTDQVRMILPAPKVVLGSRSATPIDWPLSGGRDYSRLTTYHDGTSILGVGGAEDFVAAYDPARQTGLVHYADSGALAARKFWTWGTGSQSDLWARRVSDDARPYLEMQAGPRVSLSEFAWMQPYEMVRFEECWIPVSRIGPPARANPQAAVRLTVEKPPAPAERGSSPGKARATLGVLATGEIPAAQVELRDRWRRIWHIQADLTPRTPLLQTVSINAEDVDSLRLIVRDAHGRIVIEHIHGQYARQAEVPEVPNLQARGANASTAAGAVQRFEWSWMDCRYDDAVRTMEQALRQWPDDPSVCFEGGVLRLWQGLPTQALALLGPPGWRDGAEAVQAGYYIALAFAQRGEPGKAVPLLAELEKLDSGSADAWVWKRAAHILHARVLLAAGRFREAHAMVQAVLRVEPDDPYVAALGVYALRQDGRVDMARRLARRCLAQADLEPMARLEVQILSLQPDPTLERMLQRDPEVGIELACDYISVGDWSMAEAILTGGVGENARSAITWLLAGDCAEVLGHAGRAAEHRRRAEAAPLRLVFPSRIEEWQAAERALKAEPRSARAAWYAGLALMRLMRYDEAMLQWQRAVAIRDDNPLARRCLGMAMARIESKPEQAAAQLEKAAQLAPEFTQFYLDLAGLYEDLLRPQDAREVLEQAWRMAPRSDDLAAALGRSYLALGQYRQATCVLDGHRFNPAGNHDETENRAVAWLGVGLQDMLQTDPQAALAAFDRALDPPAALSAVPQEDPQAPAMIQFWRATALRALGRSEQARQVWQRAAGMAADRSFRGGYYNVMNEAHAALAMKALGQTDAYDRQITRLTAQPSPRRARRPGMSNWMQAYMAFRETWGRLLQESGAFDPAAFETLARDRHLSSPWGDLSILAARALQKWAPGPASRKIAKVEGSGGG